MIAVAAPRSIDSYVAARQQAVPDSYNLRNECIKLSKLSRKAKGRAPNGARPFRF